ncbi:MAG: type II toxin-antitoxin system HigB family toxin [Acidobacteriota bacterium]
MRVISHRAIVKYGLKHSNALPALDTWYRTTRRAAWKNLADTRRDFPHADLVDDKTVFNIKGNSHRLIAWINYRTQKVFILDVLTHAEYDKGAWKR